MNILIIITVLLFIYLFILQPILRQRKVDKMIKKIDEILKKKGDK